MRIFITGATGFVGTAVTAELLRAGHQVLGLARSDANAKALVDAGAQVHRGSLEDLESLERGAAASDGVIHTAFGHDFARFAAVCATDRAAIETMGNALAGSNRPFVVTSGTGGKPGKPGTEDDVTDPALAGAAAERLRSETVAMAFASRGVRASLVRLPRSVHGDGDRGFVPMLIAAARAKGVSAYVGDGDNRWPAVHKADAAVVYRLAIEKGLAGARHHAVGDEGIATREIAAAIGRRLNLPLASKTIEEAPDHFGPFAGRFFGIDCPASSALTQQRLGWKPAHIGLIADIESGHYFD